MKVKQSASNSTEALPPSEINDVTRVQPTKLHKHFVSILLPSIFFFSQLPISFLLSQK